MFYVLMAFWEFLAFSDRLMFRASARLVEFFADILKVAGDTPPRTVAS